MHVNGKVKAPRIERIPGGLFRRLGLFGLLASLSEPDSIVQTVAEFPQRWRAFALAYLLVPADSRYSMVRH